MPAQLPLPSADERAHSERLAALIRAEIRVSGALPFARFMELALYAPGLGYYSAGKTKFGAAGDFVTAPELGPLFAQCLCQAFLPVLAEIESPIIFEVGPGSGALVADLLLELDRRGSLPKRYWMLECSAELRARQRETLQLRCPQFMSLVEWLDTPPSAPWQGVLLANEVIDALPATRFVLRAGGNFLEHVALGPDDRFVLVDRPATGMASSQIDTLLSTLPEPLPHPYRSEFQPELPAWLDAVAGQMRRGLALFSDYGYPRREFYLPERRNGTLMCHYRHRSHDNPLILPGLQDITASVDFTALAAAGTSVGFELSGYTTQAQFLLSSGLSEMLERANELPQMERVRLNNQAKRLVMPSEMGERFQFLGLQRGLLTQLPVFALDHRRRL